jgi:hypothetical protein
VTVIAAIEAIAPNLVIRKRCALQEAMHSDLMSQMGPNSEVELCLSSSA